MLCVELILNLALLAASQNRLSSRTTPSREYILLCICIMHMSDLWSFYCALAHPNTAAPGVCGGPCFFPSSPLCFAGFSGCSNTFESANQPIHSLPTALRSVSISQLACRNVNPTNHAHSFCCSSIPSPFPSPLLSSLDNSMESDPRSRLQ